MTFTTLIFLIFLAVVFTVYWTLGNRNRQNWLLLAASYFFYGWWDWRFCGLMAFSSVADYWFGRALGTCPSARNRKWLLGGCCFISLGILGFFKYFNFFTASFQSLLELFGWRINPFVLQVVLPLGVSFYTFQSLAYIIDVYHRKLQPANSLRDYAVFVAFFPQLVAGPIQRASDLLPQVCRERCFDAGVAVDGLRQMLWGFVKKMVLADNLAMFADQAFGAPGDFSGRQLAFATFAFAVQIYCDFSGYSDIAIGTSRLFGFQLTRNFSYPYFSRSVTEFWRHWHIGLSTWFRDYVYIPLGGNRRSPARTKVNLLITFALSGLWHGASWNYVIWGVLNGMGVLLCPSVGKRPSADQTPAVPTLVLLARFRIIFGMVATFVFINFT